MRGKTGEVSSWNWSCRSNFSPLEVPVCFYSSGKAARIFHRRRRRRLMGAVAAAAENHSHLISNEVPSFDALRDSTCLVFCFLQGELAALLKRTASPCLRKHFCLSKIKHPPAAAFQEMVSIMKPSIVLNLGPVWASHLLGWFETSPAECLRLWSTLTLLLAGVDLSASIALISLQSGSRRTTNTFPDLAKRTKPITDLDNLSAASYETHIWLQRLWYTT